MLTLKDIVKNNTAYFSHYRAMHLYYTVKVAGDNYIFPVPIEDIGEASFSNEDKAIIMMRYIRKAMEEGTFVRA